MNTSWMSLSPMERTSWRCVPSPQSNRMRSPPRRTSSAGRPRRAVGAEPAVPAKNSDRSMICRERSRAAAVGAVLLAMLAAAPARAATPRGPQAGLVLDSLDGGDLARVRAARVKVVRMFVFANDYRPGIVGQVIDRLAAVGARPLFVVVGDTQHPPVTPEAVDAYARFVGGLAAQGRGRGGGWGVRDEQGAPGGGGGGAPGAGGGQDAGG